MCDKLSQKGYKMCVIKELNRKEIEQILDGFGIEAFENSEMIDSSHGNRDIRHNYIIDKKYVLRINSAQVMTEERVVELNTLVKKYNDFGIKAPYFIPNKLGKYVMEYKKCYCYLSEYLDFPLAIDTESMFKRELYNERIAFVCRFAEKFKDDELSDTLSMYSLFELAPYDQPKGIDEKQENFNNLIEDLKVAGELELVNRLTMAYETIRAELMSIYKTLPRCVFQGDENLSNLCIDENKHIVGLFDFNMAGTEVIVNYLANIAFQGDFDFSEELLEDCSAEEIFDRMMFAYIDSTKNIQKYYQFSREEKRAYELYSCVVLISGYMNQWAYSEFLKSEKYKVKMVELLWLVEGELKKYYQK